MTPRDREQEQIRAIVDLIEGDQAHMDMGSMDDVQLEVVDDEIVVSLPGSHYSVTYYKPEKVPQLLAKRISDRDDPRAPMTVAEFLAKAWKLANAKARELGWIV